MDVESNCVVIISGSKTQPSSKIISPTPRTKVNNKDVENKQSSESSQGSQICYRMSDAVLSLGLILPLVIGFWRGVWQLMDIYSAKWEVDPWLSIGTGYIIPFFLYWFQEPLKRIVNPSRMSFGLFYFITRCLLLIHSFASVNQWRGLWLLLDMETGGVEGIEGTYSAIFSLAVGVFFSVILKTFINVLAPPLFTFVDEGNTIHDCPLRFNTLPKSGLRYFLDCFFSVVVVASFVVCCWRGVWNLADIYLYPGKENELKSALASLGFGYGLCLIMFKAQPSIYRLEKRLKGLVRLTVLDMLVFLQFLGCVFAWRGLWNSYNILIVFDTLGTSEWVTTIIGAAGATIFGCISSIVVRGITIDGETVDEWTIPYISLLQTQIYNVPFPEPWICRYLCTPQKMNVVKGKGRRKDKVHVISNCHKTDYDGSSIPLKKMNSKEALKNSVHPEDVLKASSNRFSDLPNIDSSSEEELGMRALMFPDNTPDEHTMTSHHDV